MVALDAGDTGVAGHPLWHLLAVVAVPAIIIVAFRLHDRRRHLALSGPRGARHPRRGSLHPRWRLAAAACGGAALIHAAVCPGHFQEGTVLGVFFLVLSASQLTWSAAILLRPSAPLLLIGAAANALVIGLWLCTRTLGLPLGLLEGGVEPVGAVDVLASALEAVTVGLCVLQLRSVIAV